MFDAVVFKFRIVVREILLRTPTRGCSRQGGVQSSETKKFYRIRHEESRLLNEGSLDEISFDGRHGVVTISREREYKWKFNLYSIKLSDLSRESRSMLKLYNC